MANIKLLADLKLLTMLNDPDIVDVAKRAIEEIEYLENEIRVKQSALDWYDFEPGDMK